MRATVTRGRQVPHPASTRVGEHVGSRPLAGVLLRRLGRFLYRGSIGGEDGGAEGQTHPDGPARRHAARAQRCRHACLLTRRVQMVSLDRPAQCQVRNLSPRARRIVATRMHAPMNATMMEPMNLKDLCRKLTLTFDRCNVLAL
jgi:hypothetical protein